MAARLRKRAIKPRKKVRKNSSIAKKVRKVGPIAKIVKKPLTMEERKKKMRKDILRIARRYEEMRLYDDAITFYKKLGKHADVERLTDIKNNIYIEKAREFERQDKHEDALRLYENLKMTEDMDRIKRLLGKKTTAVTSTPKSTASETIIEQEVDTPQEFEEIADEPSVSSIEEEQEQSIQRSLDAPEAHEKTKNASDTPKKMFNICPYCGEELNLPKSPKFCPYCTEALA